MKDHEVAQLVNKLTGIARKYGQAQQLRDRIAYEIIPLKDKLAAPIPTEEKEGKKNE